MGGGFWGAVGAEAAADLRARSGPRAFARGQALMHVGQVPREVLVLLAGRVKVSATTAAGRTVLLAFRGPGDLVGELAALDDEPRSASVVALEPVQALAVGRDEFRAFLVERPAVALVLLSELTSRLRDADAKRVQLAAYTTVGRVAFCLLELCERFGEGGDGAVEILLPLSQEELASWAGASIESVGRALQTMRRLGWIETGRRAIRVLDRGALAGATA
jgi:CRP/FNR family transcriptional regulator, cyclic AMP receptor protein